MDPKEVGKNYGGYRVTRVFTGSPAAKAGLLANDKLVKIGKINREKVLYLLEGRECNYAENLKVVSTQSLTLTTDASNILKDHSDYSNLTNSFTMNERFWTGSGSQGGVISTLTCNDWLSGANNIKGSAATVTHNGINSQIEYRWCSEPAKLLCICY